MWEFWRSRLSKGKTRHRPRDSDPDSPHRYNANREFLEPGEEQSPGYNYPQPVNENSTHVYFKDIILPASDDEDSISGSDDEGLSPASFDVPEATQVPGTTLMPGSGRRRRGVDRQKLIIILVGLPGRGKTFLCNKLMCYLNWLGHETKHFNVGQYRRKQNEAADVQDASFFDHNNPAGLKAREEALDAALEDMCSWLDGAGAQVAIFDATNSTESRRQTLRRRFHNHYQYLFIESICNDTVVLEQNYRYKMMYSPDYAGFDDEQAALEDFRDRIRKYEEVYETITNRDLHYIKLIDMVTGKGYMDVNRISGYIPGKIVFFLMQVCKAGLSRLRKIWLTRHGQSMSNTLELLGGDSHLSPRGAVYAKKLPDILIDRVPLTAQGGPMPVSVWTSTLQRTIQTAQQIPFPKLRWKVLDEIQAGMFDGMTYAQIEQTMPEEFAARKADKLGYRYPSGESYLDVIQRLEPVIIEIERERECVCVVAHQAILRCLYGYFHRIPLADIPRLEMPLHTLIELVPMPDGNMAETRIKVDVDKDLAIMEQEIQKAMSSSSSGVDLKAAQQTGVWNQHTGKWTTTSNLLSSQLSNQLSLGANAVQIQRAMSGVGVEVFMPGRRAAHANGKGNATKPSKMVPIQSEGNLCDAGTDDTGSDSSTGVALSKLMNDATKGPPAAGSILPQPLMQALSSRNPSQSLAHSGIIVSQPVSAGESRPWGRDSMESRGAGPMSMMAMGAPLPTIPSSVGSPQGSFNNMSMASSVSAFDAESLNTRLSVEGAHHRRGRSGLDSDRSTGEPGDLMHKASQSSGGFNPSPFASFSAMPLYDDEDNNTFQADDDAEAASLPTPGDVDSEASGAPSTFESASLPPLSPQPFAAHRAPTSVANAGVTVKTLSDDTSAS